MQTRLSGQAPRSLRARFSGGKARGDGRHKAGCRQMIGPSLSGALIRLASIICSRLARLEEGLHPHLAQHDAGSGGDSLVAVVGRRDALE